MNLAAEIRRRVNAGKSIDPMAGVILDAVAVPSNAEGVLIAAQRLIAANRAHCSPSLAGRACADCASHKCAVRDLAHAVAVYEYELATAHLRRMEMEGMNHERS